MTNINGLIYSIDENITISQLKKNKIDFSKYDISKISDWLKKNNINFVIDGNNKYHYKFLYIKPKPYIVYYKGDLNILNKSILAIVGPRKNSFYGKNVLEKLFEKLSGYNIVTISGLADGIDKLAHNLSIKYKIPTIAVLGGGFYHFLNSTDRNFIEKIIDNGGLILSEFKIKQKPTTYTFPQRNRIIAGLADTIFLPEAGIDSGSLITVDFGYKINKKIFATPNSIFDENSKGINKYISENKITAVYDIQEFVEKIFGKNIKTNNNLDISNLGEDEKKIINIISKNQNIDLNKLAILTKKDFSEILNIITLLEIKGLIYEKSPGIYQIKK